MRKEEWIEKKSKFNLKYYKWYKLSTGIYFVLLIVAIVVSILIYVVCKLPYFSQRFKDISLSLYTGFIASITVSTIIQLVQDKAQHEKKRAILFDLRFYFIRMEDKMKAQSLLLNSNSLEDCSKKMIIFKPVLKCVYELYKSNMNLFDKIEISFIRKLLMNYHFFNELIEESNKEIFDDSDAQRMEESIINLVETIQENLYCLMIKLKEDKIL